MNQPVRDQLADDAAPANRRPSILLVRAARLRCPWCGIGKLFSNRLRMHSRCQHCGLPFQREPGYWLGSIYVNYGLTALLVTAAYFALFFSDVLEQTTVLWILTIGCVLFPLWFFRYARAIWLAFDLYFDPPHFTELEPQKLQTREVPD